MPYILTQESYIICPHGGRLQHAPKLTAGGQIFLHGHPVFFFDDTYYVTGCPFGCDKIDWTSYYPNMTFDNRYFLTNQDSARCWHPTKGSTGNAILMFFQMKMDVEEFIRLWSKANKK